MANLLSKVSGIKGAFATSLLPRLLLLKAFWCFPGAARRAWGQGWSGQEERLKKSCRAERWSHGARLSQGGTGWWALFTFHMKAIRGAIFGSSCMGARLVKLYSPCLQLDQGVERGEAGRALALTWHKEHLWVLTVAALGSLAACCPSSPLSSLFAGEEFAVPVSPLAADPL